MVKVRFRPLSREKPCCDLSAGAKKKGLCVGVCNLVIIAVAFVIWGAWPRKESVSDNAVESFSEKVLRRCLDYAPPPGAPLRGDKDCKKIEEAFRNAVASKDPCHFSSEDYQPVMKLVNQHIPCNKVLFWSKTKELAHSYQGELLTLEDMLLGHIVDGLTWCGDRKTSEVQLDSCPEESNTCPHPAAGVFWNVSSKWFAENACGQVRVILNGSLSHPFSRNSTFGSVEALNLPSKVYKLQAWVIHEEPVRDTCSGSSINDLKSVLRENIEFTCKDMDRETFIQCVENPEGSQCKSVV
ncbi:ADP-ribosyl cyclase/cyclic ADP-ribose hydrolase 1-like [Talpa occidentalis]|uniref:ADP-ribosyl cyclase/cyclic ADP-ribose hydrolase 1-like n=1 Tax=Talpa occidentalis TaxID=50954 RepID=UPI0018907F39|nr:ADP-ribosyl cyclase/cyclic ADP-ribose hydrolase 1-like [Talpa occidentalis]